MKPIPFDMQNWYSSLLKETVPQAKHANYLKWCRFFYDFCSKYTFTPYEKESISHFSQKLGEKGQTPQDIEEAVTAIGLFQTYYSQGFTRKELHSSVDVMQQMISIMREKNYSPRTIEAYTKWARWFLNYHKGTVEEIDDSSVRMFLNHLTIEKKVSASAHNQAFNALLYLFRHVLHKDFGDQETNVRSRKGAEKLPVVLSRKEVDKLLDAVDPPYKLMTMLMYGCGLRLSELVSIRIKDCDFDNNLLYIMDSKGGKSRTVPLPMILQDELIAAVNNSLARHMRNVGTYGEEYAGAFLPQQVKTQSYGLERAWQWLFPASSVVRERETGLMKQYHVHHTAFSKAYHEGLKRTDIVKYVTPHTLRHSYATHLLQLGYDIRTVQELLGHKNIQTTMVYLHVMKNSEQKAPLSPLDIPLY